MIELEILKERVWKW